MQTIDLSKLTWVDVPCFRLMTVKEANLSEFFKEYELVYSDLVVTIRKYPVNYTILIYLNDYSTLEARGIYEIIRVAHADFESDPEKVFNQIKDMILNYANGVIYD